MNHRYLDRLTVMIRHMLIVSTSRVSSGLVCLIIFSQEVLTCVSQNDYYVVREDLQHQ